MDTYNNAPEALVDANVDALKFGHDDLKDMDGALPPPNMFGFRHVGVYMSFLCIGFIMGSGQAIVYPIVVIMHGEPNNMQKGIANLFLIFSTFKLVFGFVSDRFPICGYRRKPYLLIGWSIAILASFALALTATLSGTSEICQNEARNRQVPCNGSQANGPFHVANLSMGSLVGWMVLNNFGFVMADVAMDSMAMELAKREAPDQRGAIQGYCYTVRALGSIVSYALTGLFLNGPTYNGSFDFELSVPTFLWVLVGLQCLGLPFWIALEDTKVTQPTSTSVKAVWAIIQNKALSKMFIFVFLYSLSSQVAVAARDSVVHTWVHMQPVAYAGDRGVQQVVAAATFYASARWLRRYNWHGLLAFGTMYGIVFMMLFWLVVFDVVRNQWFVMFIDFDQMFAKDLGHLVAVWCTAEMAPAGLEGITFAFMATIGNAGSCLGSYVTMGLNGFFELSRDALVEDTPDVRWQYLFNALAVMAANLFYLQFMSFMPPRRQEACARFARRDLSVAWAIMAVMLAVAAVLWNAGTSIGAVVCPCSHIVGGTGCPDGCTR